MDFKPFAFCIIEQALSEIVESYVVEELKVGRLAKGPIYVRRLR